MAGPKGPEFYQTRSIEMTDSNSPNHWDALASTLGAQPTPQEVDATQPKPTVSQTPPPRKPAPRKESVAAAPPRTANWDMLASELGLEPAPQPVAPPRAAAPRQVVPPAIPKQERRPVPPAAFAPKPAAFAPKQEDQAPTPPELPEESPNFFDERFDFEEPFDLLESSETPAGAAEAGEETAESTEKRPRKRRRRRRRGRGGESREAGVSATEEAVPTLAEDLDREPVVAQAEATGEESPDEAAAEGETEEKRRPRRRRSRRGRKRREPEAVEGVAAVPAEGAAPAEAHDEDMLDEHLLAADDLLDVGEGEEGDEERPARLGFRGIPSWQETVGLLVDKNIEARSKRPAGGPHHGRGGSRGPRDNRGGRGGGRGQGGKRPPS